MRAREREDPLTFPATIGAGVEPLRHRSVA
jgi:hypothetical protein